MPRIPRKFILPALALGLFAPPVSAEHHEHDDDHDHDHGELVAGHFDVEVAFEEGELHLHIHDETADKELEPGEVVLSVPEEAESSVPEGANYAFLGNVGDPLWILPQNAQADVIFLGVAGEIEAGALMSDTAYVELVSVDGPGNFFVYDTDAFGVPNVMINSADGISSEDRLTVPAGAHFHVDWTFDAEGDYDVTFVIHATLVDGTPISSEEATLAFEVGHHEDDDDGHGHGHDHGDDLAAGHADVEVAFEDGELHLHIHDETNEKELEPSEVVLNVPEEAESSVPEGDAYSFLGNVGDPLWILPQNAQADVLFLGVAGEIETGVLTNDTAYLELVSVDGPGNFFVYDTDAFGVPNVMINSADGITEGDRLEVMAGSHFHVDWTFDAEGDYDITFVIHATLIDGTPISSEEATLAFEVGHHEDDDDGHGHAHGGDVVELETGHADVGVAFEDGELELHIHDETADVEREPSDVILRVPEIAETTVPEGEDYAFLGHAGDPLWILPQVAQTDVLFLGVAGEEIEDGALMDDTAYVELVSVDGPGNFFVYDTDAFGVPNVMINSADGITEGDRLTVLAGSHFHVDWTFDAEGDYDITFVIHAALADGTPISSEEATLAFEVGDHDEHGDGILRLKEGEIDLGVAYEEGAFDLHLHDHAADIEYESGDARLFAAVLAKTTVPEDPKFNFLGTPGDAVWILPQREDPHLLFLGLAGEEIEARVFQDDRVELSVVGLEGPGDLFLYSVDGLGAVNVHFNTGDGVTGADHYDVGAGSHAHANWAFSEPGIYELTLQASGTLTEGGAVQSEPVTFTFEVEPIELNIDIVQDHGHIELLLASQEGIVYQMETSTDLQTWTEEGEPFEGTGHDMAMELPDESEALYTRLKVVEND